MKAFRTLGLWAALGLSACGSSESLDADALWARIGIGQSEEFVSRYLALIKSGAPALQIGFPDTPSGGGLLLLERQSDEFQYWLSAEGAQVIFQNGMLHGLRGFGEGLLASELTEPLTFVRTFKPGISDRFHTYLDGNDRAVTRTYRCVFEDKGVQKIVLGSAQVPARLMTEQCRNLDQQFENFYWMHPVRRTILLSRQWAGPHLGALSTRVVW